LFQTTHVILSEAKDPFSYQKNTDSSLRFGMTEEGRNCSINWNLSNKEKPSGMQMPEGFILI